MRHGLILIVLLVLNGCCCDFTKKESYAQVPLTLSDAKELEKDGATVTVTRETARGGSDWGKCGHSPLCVIFVPLIIFDSVFPKQWDEVVVTSKDGVVTLVGWYETGGALIHAQHLVDGEMRETRSIDLKELGKKVYVDSARLVPQPDGGVERVVLPLSSQHDFIAEERKLLSTEKDPQRRARAIDEARVQLETEGFELARERLAAADEDDETKAELLRLGCGTDEFEPLIAEAQKNPGPWTKVRLVSCLKDAAHDAMVLQVEEVACDSKTKKKLMQEIGSLFRDEEMKVVLREGHAKCPQGPHRALVALWLQLPVDVKDLDALLVSDLAGDARQHLLTTEPIHRAALVKLVMADNDVELALDRLVRGETVLEPELLEQLAGWYVKPKGLFTTSPRVKVLELFSYAALAPDGPVRTKAARAVLTKAKADPVLESARVALGDRDRIAAAAKGIRSPLYSGYPVSESDLVAFGLKLAGCPQEELVAVADGKKSMPVCR